MAKTPTKPTTDAVDEEFENAEDKGVRGQAETEAEAEVKVECFPDVASGRR